MAVRRESVRLELQDAGFSTGMARAAAATGLLEGRLDSLSGKAIETDRSLRVTSDGVDDVGGSSRKAGPDIDRFSGRLRLLADTALVLGPALVPVGAVGVPAVAGLASQLGFATLGAVSLVAAVQGVGDALTAVEKARLDPTAENLAAARQAMEGLAPQAAEFVRSFQELRPVLDSLRDSAAAGWFPGLTDALDSFEKAAPSLQRILFGISQAGGDLVSEAAASLAGPEWREFRDFIEAEAPSAVTALGHTVGNLAQAMAQLWMAFDPLNDDFSGWLLEQSQAFEDWASNLSETEGFQDFLAYIRENGPRVADAAAAIAEAVVAIVEAVAPLGGTSLALIEGIARAIDTIANSRFGPAIAALAAAMSAARLATKVWEGAATGLSGALAVLQGKTATTTGAISGMTRATTIAAAALAGLTVIDAIQSRSNDASVGVNALADALLKIEPSSSLPGDLDGLSTAIERLADPNTAEQLQQTITDALGGIGEEGELTEARAQIEGIDDALTQIATTKGAPAAERAFQNLADAARLTPQAITDLRNQLPKFEDAMAGAADGADRYRARLALLRRETAANRAAARETAKSFITLGDSLDDSKTSFHEWLRELEKQAEALRNFRLNAEKAADKGLRKGLIAALQEAGPAGALRMRQLANASESEIDRANRAWKSGQDEIRRYTDKVGGVQRSLEELDRTKANPWVNLYDAPFQKKKKDVDSDLEQLSGVTANPKVDVDASQARAEIAETQRLLNGIGDESVNIVVNATKGAGGRLFGAIGLASGGTVPGPRYPYRDKMLTVTAPGEEIISNRFGQADKNRAALKAANAGAKLAVVGYADGGTVQRSRPVERRELRPLAASSGSRTVHHVFEVRVAGALDARSAMADLRQEMHEVSTFVVDQHETFRAQQYG